VTEHLQNAAVVLSALPKSQAAKVMSRMTPRELKPVMQVLRDVHGLHPERREEILIRFLSELKQRASSSEAKGSASRSDQTDSHSPTGSVSQTGRSQRITNHRVTLAADHDEAFHFLSGIAFEELLRLVVDEHPLHIATVLANLDPEVGQELLRRLDAPLRISTIKRLCQLEGDTKQAGRELAFTLKLKLRGLRGQRAGATDGLALASQLLSLVDDHMRDEVLRSISQTDPELKSHLHELIPSFEDLHGLDDQEIRKLLAHADTSLWAPALKVASSELRQRVIACMHDRPASILDMEMAAFDPKSGISPRFAQAKILAACLELGRMGEIRPIHHQYSHPAADLSSVN
jgi:flagellar motor switch protein FliG